MYFCTLLRVMADVHDERCLSQRALLSERPSQIKKTVFEGVRSVLFLKGSRGDGFKKNTKGSFVPLITLPPPMYTHPS